MWKERSTLSLLNATGTCGEPSWLHNEGNVPEDDEQNEVLDERVRAPEGHPRPRLYSHTWLSFQKREEFRRNTCFRVHCQVCSAEQSLQRTGTGFN